MSKFKRIVSFLMCFVISFFTISSSLIVQAHAESIYDKYGVAGVILDVLAGSTVFEHIPWWSSSAGNYASSKPQNYYTGVTSSVVDKSGNVTNYYRGGDTTNTNIIDSYNKTFNTIYNTTNNTTTNQYSANVKLENFLNQYTTNNVTNNNTYSANFNSWYYDNTTNNYTYNEFNKYDTTNNYLYYNQDNSRYYISIDNSTDEYYLIDVQYSPTFVTVNYTYNTTNINNSETVGDVTNVYYFELTDGRNSSTLTADEVAGMVFGYDVVNYELVTDDPNTLSLQHFDGDYSDSSSFNRTFYSQNRSNSYVDSGAFGKAVSLPNGSAAGVTIPGLSGYSSLSFDFRVYFNDIANLKVYLGDTCILQKIPDYRSWTGTEIYDDNGSTGYKDSFDNTNAYKVGSNYSKILGNWSTTLKSSSGIPASADDSDYEEVYSASSKVGFLSGFSSPTFNERTYSRYDNCYSVVPSYDDYLQQQHTWCWFKRTNTASVEYRSTPIIPVSADFSYDTYKNQWVSMRITISGGKLYYFVNGDLVGSGSFTKPSADKFYIKSSGTVYLDELRVSTGSLSSTSTYNPSNAPYDTNKVLALPDPLVANTIYVQHITPVTNHRIGGVRPSNPSNGFFYIPLHADYTGGQPQFYVDGNWIDVVAMVYDGESLHNALGFQFSPVGASPDINPDAKPERPSKPEDDPDPDTCDHDWIENIADSIAPTCTLAGMKSYTCSKCEKEKVESVPLLDHDWMVKAKMPNQYDEEGNQISIGFTIFECLRCQEQYKSIDGTAPPPLNPGSSSTVPGGSSGDDEGEEGFLAWLLRKAGELLGAVGKGLISFLQGVLDGIFGGLFDLIESVFGNLLELVDLFGSFGDALGVLWTWLPSEVVIVLVAGVSVFVLIALLKLIMK